MPRTNGRRSGVTRLPFLMASLATGAIAAAALGGAGAQERAAPKKPVDPASIWPASLTQFEGRFVYAQVASPGGLWESIPSGDEKVALRQIAIDDLPAALRDRLRKAEIVVSDIHRPTEVEAEE